MTGRYTRWIDPDGYIRIYDKKIKKIMLEHRRVIEKRLKCCLLKSASVHHKDKNRQNNKFSNLEVFSRSFHTWHHNSTIDKSNRQCYHCGSTTTYVTKRNSHLWHKHNDDQWLCHKCHKRLPHVRERKNQLRRVSGGVSSIIDQ